MPILNFFGQPVKENEQPKKEEEENNKNSVEEKSKEEVDEEEWIDASAPNDDETETVDEKIADNKDRDQEQQEKQEKQEKDEEATATTTPADHEPQVQQPPQQTPQNENNNQEEAQQQQQLPPPFRLHPIQLGVLVGLLLTRHYKIFSFATFLIFHSLVVQTVKSCFEGHEEHLEKGKRAISNVAEKMKRKYVFVKDRVKVAIAGLKGDDHIREGDDDDMQRRLTEVKKRRRIVVAFIVLVVFVIVIGNCFLVVLARERNALHAELQQLKTTPQAIEKDLIRFKLENQKLMESNYNLTHFVKSECQSGLRRCQRDLAEEKKTHKQEVDKIINEMKAELKKQKNDKEKQEQAMNSEQKETNHQNQQQQTQTQSSSASSNSNLNNCGPYKRRCGESFKEKLMKRRQEAKKQQQQRDMKTNTNDNNNNKNKKRKFQPLTALGEFLNPFFEWQLDFEL